MRTDGRRERIHTPCADAFAGGRPSRWSRLRRGAWIAAAVAAPALPVLSGCPGTIDDKERFLKRDAGADASCSDVLALFAERCGGRGCHGPDETAASLDLVTAGVEKRVTGQSGTTCNGVLADPAQPEQSLLYVKLTDTPGCGARMPYGIAPLADAEVACVAEWIAGLTPVDPCDGGDCGCPTCVCVPGTSEACYSGPEGTEGVGMCAAGMRTCNTEGTSWGPCAGEVLPAFDACDTPEDEDCNGLAPSCTESWSRIFGDATGQYARAVAADENGNVIVAGQFEGVVDFGGGPLTATGTSVDAFLAKYDKFGTHLWSKAFSGESNQFAMSLAIDAAGGILLAGRFFREIDLGGGAVRSHGSDDAFIAKLDADGNHVWSKAIGGSTADRCDRVAVDAGGNVLLTGGFTGTADVAGALLVSAGDRDVFILKLDANGQRVFALRAGGAGDDYGHGIAADALGNVLVTGWFSESIAFGGAPFASAGGTDVFVAKLDAAGQHIFSAGYGGPGAEEAQDLAVVTATNEIVVTGTFSSTIDFSAGSQGALTSAGERDLFVAKLTADGAHVFSRGFGDAQDQLFTSFETGARVSVTVLPPGDIVLSGPLFGAADFGGGALTSAGRTDVYLVRLDATGAHVGSRLFGDSQTQVGIDVGTDGDGNLLVVGRSYGTINFGSGQLTGAGDGDAFVAKLVFP